LKKVRMRYLELTYILNIGLFDNFSSNFQL